MAKSAKDKQAVVPGTTKRGSAKPTDAEKVDEYMNSISHAFKKEMEEVRNIIKNTDKRIGERIKWKAPSYYYKEDLVTFNGWATKNVHLVFHHPYIVKIKSGLLEGDYKDRRMAYFTDMADIQSKKKELERIMKELVKHMDNK